MDTLTKLQQEARERAEEKRRRDQVEAKKVVRHYAQAQEWGEGEADTVELMLGL